MEKNIGVGGVNLDVLSAMKKVLNRLMKDGMKRHGAMVKVMHMSEKEVLEEAARLTSSKTGRERVLNSKLAKSMLLNPDSVMNPCLNDDKPNKDSGKALDVLNQTAHEKMVKMAKLTDRAMNSWKKLHAAQSAWEAMKEKLEQDGLWGAYCKASKSTIDVTFFDLGA